MEMRRTVSIDTQNANAQLTISSVYFTYCRYERIMSSNDYRRDKTTSLLLSIFSTRWTSLIDLHGRWSHFDPDRLEKITCLLHRTSNSEQSLSIVQQAIMYFTQNTTLNLTCEFSIDRILMEVKENHHLNPYRDDCPVCGLKLDPEHAKIKRVKMYCTRGHLIQSILFITNGNSESNVSFNYRCGGFCCLLSYPKFLFKGSTSLCLPELRPSKQGWYLDIWESQQGTIRVRRRQVFLWMSSVGRIHLSIDGITEFLE